MSGQARFVRPYGDRTDDGMMQVSFTMPLPAGPIAQAAAVQLCARMGLDRVIVAHAQPIGNDFTFFVVYGSVRHVVDLDTVVLPEQENTLLSPDEVNAAVKDLLHRKLVVVGACIGTDAHTVGLDAILNVKGFGGEKGLEYYRELRVVNLGAQVSIAELLERSQVERADAVLVSQVVTQRGTHLATVRQMADAFSAELGARRPLLVAGGPRLDPASASSMGVDRVFGRGTTPRQVVSWLVQELRRRSTGVPVGPCPAPNTEAATVPDTPEV